MLAPVYQLLFGENELRHWMKTLELVENQVTVFYKTYKTNNRDDMRAIVDQKLAPGKLPDKFWHTQIALLRQNHSFITRVMTLVAAVGTDQVEVSHAMVLDSFDSDRDLLIFKNTYDSAETGQPKKFEIQRCHPNAPQELYFVHIEIRDMDNLPSQEQRGMNKKAEFQKRKQTYRTEPTRK